MDLWSGLSSEQVCSGLTHAVACTVTVQVSLSQLKEDVFVTAQVSDREFYAYEEAIALAGRRAVLTAPGALLHDPSCTVNSGV